MAWCWAGMFTWGNTQRESYLNTITIIDQLGQFIERHAAAGYQVFGGGAVKVREDRAEIAASIMPYLRGAVSRKQRWIGSFSDSSQVLDFVDSVQAEKLAHLGTSCPITSFERRFDRCLSNGTRGVSRVN